MSRDASLTRDFGDAEYRFRLGYGDLEELQEAMDCGPWYLLAQFSGLGQMLLNPAAVRGLGVKAPREIIRIALIGGGTKPADALKLVRTYVEARPPDESIGLAYEILQAALQGAPDEEIKKKADSSSDPLTTFPEESFVSPPSSEPAPRSATRRRKSGA